MFVLKVAMNYHISQHFRGAPAGIWEENFTPNSSEIYVVKLDNCLKMSTWLSWHSYYYMVSYCSI